MGIRPSSQSNPTAIAQHIGSDMDKVREVADRIDEISNLGEALLNGDLNDVAAISDEITLVADNIETIQAIGPNADNLGTVAGSIDNINKYLGAAIVDPSTRPSGDPLEDGDYYFNTTLDAMVFFDLAEGLWKEVDVSGVTAAKEAAEQSATESEAAKDVAIANRNEASTFASASETARDESVAAKDTAVTKASEANTSASLAEGHKTDAETAATAANDAKADAEAAKNSVDTTKGQIDIIKTDIDTKHSTVVTKAQEASDDADDALLSAQSASGSASTATTKATEATNAANVATTKRDEASTYRDQAQGFRNEAEGFRDQAQTSESVASSSAAISAANANFRGNWSDLTGAATVPYSVLHNDNVWMLTSDVGNVTTVEPGIDSVWVSIASTGGAATDSARLGGELPSFFVNMENMIESANAKVFTDAERTKLSNALVEADKGANNGVAELDGTGKVPASQLPTLASEISDINGLQDALDDKSDASHNHPISDITNLQDELNSKSDNTHTHTADEVGLGNVDNTSDLDKPVSTAQQAALDDKVDTADVGQANGVASLDATGKVPSAQLPELGGGSGTQSVVTENSVVRVQQPLGASGYFAAASTGAIGIKLPVLYSGNMVKMSISVYEYSNDKTYDIQLVGYLFTSSTRWDSVDAAIIGDGSKFLNVNFGNDGSNAVVWLGDTDEEWAGHTLVTVKSVEVFFGTLNEDDWKDGWSIVSGETTFAQRDVTKPAKTFLASTSSTTVKELTLYGTETYPLTAPSGGWSRYDTFKSKSDGAKESYLGVYGNGDTVSYTYIGTNSDSANTAKHTITDQLRIYPDKLHWGVHEVLHEGKSTFTPASGDITFEGDVKTSGSFDTASATTLTLKANGATRMTLGNSNAGLYTGVSLNATDSKLELRKSGLSLVGGFRSVTSTNLLQLYGNDASTVIEWDSTGITLEKPTVANDQISATKFVQTSNAGSELYAVEVSRPNTQIYNPTGGQVGIGSSSSTKELEVTASQVTTTVPVVAEGNPLLQGVGGIKKIEKVLAMPETPDNETLYIVVAG